jgi:hypothetical protein
MINGLQRRSKKTDKWSKETNLDKKVNNVNEKFSKEKDSGKTSEMLKVKSSVNQIET